MGPNRVSGTDGRHHLQSVKLVREYEGMPDDKRVLVGDTGKLINPVPELSPGGKILVHFHNNKTGRRGGERHWMPTDCLELGEEYAGEIGLPVKDPTCPECGDELDQPPNPEFFECLECTWSGHDIDVCEAKYEALQ